MNAFLHAFDVALGALRVGFCWAAVAAAGLCAIEWGVRTRRINPFSRFAQITRRTMAPVMVPVERMVVRAGGSPSSAALWTLAALIVGGIVLLSALGLARNELAGVSAAFNSGPRGVLRVVIAWTFDMFYIAIIVRVVASWFQMNPYGPLVRWTFVITEPLFKPLRKFLVFGMIDLSPIGAWLLLSWILEPILMRVI